MPVLTIITNYPQANGPAFFTGAGFMSKEILDELLLKEFERVEVPNFRVFIAKEFEAPSRAEGMDN